MHIKKLAIALLCGLSALTFAGTALADTTSFAPEPETLGLIAGAAIAWAIVRWRKRK
jgi:hypothetical protein